MPPPTPRLNFASPVWVVITGNIRSGPEFWGIFEQAFELRRQGLVEGILFATWQTELQRFPSLGEALAKRGVTTVAIEPPVPVPAIHPLFHGYVLHQRKALHFALRSLPADCFVLKARTDFAEERFASMTRVLFHSEVELEVNIPQPILQKRLFTFDARTDYFFYWDDIVFCGMRNDLLALNNFEISPEVIYPAQVFAAEMRLFAPLFLKQYPVLSWFFENVHGEKFARVLHRWANAEPAVHLPALVREILAAYFHVLSRYLQLPDVKTGQRQLVMLADYFKDLPDFGVRSFALPWFSHKLVSQSPLQELLDGESLDGELSWLRARLDEMDRDVNERGRWPLGADNLINEMIVFAQKFGEEVAALPVRIVPAAKSTGSGGFEEFKFPESRRPSWWKQKRAGAQRAFVKWLLGKVL